MIENRDDTLDIDFVLDLISRQPYVDDEILLGYETVYRKIRNLAISVGIDTMEIDTIRNEIMRRYGQL